MKPALNQLLHSLSSLVLILPFVFNLTASPLLAMDDKAAQTTQVASGGDGEGIVGAFMVAGGHGHRDRERPHSTTPSTKERWFIPVSVWAGATSVLCLLISAGWIIEHFVAGHCPDQPTRFDNDTPACQNITQLFNASTDCSFARTQCDFSCK